MKIDYDVMIEKSRKLVEERAPRSEGIASALASIERAKSKPRKPGAQRSPLSRAKSRLRLATMWYHFDQIESLWSELPQDLEDEAKDALFRERAAKLTFAEFIR